MLSGSEKRTLFFLKLAFRLGFSSLILLLALLMTSLIMGESSPFHNYFIRHVELRDAWAMTILVPFMISAVITNNPHSPPTALVILALIIQWFLIGLLLSVVVPKVFLRLHNK
jgi:hypothetical protein